jgi:hypothetical protein
VNEKKATINHSMDKSRKSKNAIAFPFGNLAQLSQNGDVHCLTVCLSIVKEGFTIIV